ncbi:hypothetical protein V6Z11_A11G316800 [Gossypium hirsutum]
MSFWGFHDRGKTPMVAKDKGSGAWPAVAYGGGDVARGDMEGTEPGYGRTEVIHGGVGCGAPREPRVSESVLILGHLGHVFLV